LAGTGVTVGSVTLASGDVQLKTGVLGGWSPAAVGQPLAVGQAMETGPAGRSALALPGGISARLDGDTLLTLASAAELVIDRGALYIDAGPAAAAAPRLEVTTPSGSVRHVGTQYEVRLIGSGVRLRVREGRVEWQSKTGGIEQSRGGEQLTIAGDGSVEREATPLYGESWDWVAATTPGIEIEGLPLAEFLAWVARELGREIRFDRAETAQEAASIVLHGSISGLTPAEALNAVLATTHLRAVVAAGEIEVQGQRHPGQTGN
jgi:ferric-dicitrate binding protein FerR (iron transport regulator)